MHNITICPGAKQLAHKLMHLYNIYYAVGEEVILRRPLKNIGRLFIFLHFLSAPKE
jgi:hypothetical protein